MRFALWNWIIFEPEKGFAILIAPIDSQNNLFYKFFEFLINEYQERRSFSINDVRIYD